MAWKTLGPADSVPMWVAPDVSPSTLVMHDPDLRIDWKDREMTIRCPSCLDSVFVFSGEAIEFGHGDGTSTRCGLIFMRRCPKCDRQILTWIDINHING